MLGRELIHQQLELAFTLYSTWRKQILHKFEHRNYVPPLNNFPIVESFRRQVLSQQKDNSSEKPFCGIVMR